MIPKYIVIVHYVSGERTFEYQTLKEAKEKYRSISVQYRAYLTKVLS